MSLQFEHLYVELQMHVLTRIKYGVKWDLKVTHIWTLVFA